MKKYAYIRVSSKDQNIARQVEAMQNIGILEKEMFIDKQFYRSFRTRLWRNSGTMALSYKKGKYWYYRIRFSAFGY